MFNIDDLPFKIYCKVKNLPYKADNIGMSGADIILFDDMVLKAESSGCQADREYSILQWLENRLPVAKIIEFEKADGKNYLLMSKLQGEMICSDTSMQSAESVVSLLAEGLKMLWSIDIKDCPYSSRLDERLAAAKYNIDNNLVDLDNVEEDTFGENGFKDVDDLYDFLVSNKPNEDLVFTHGDYCLPNIFAENGSITGFLDLGKAGIADRWQDIALCVRSLKYNLCEIFGCSETEFLNCKRLFYDKIGIEEDKEKLRYYILLDELF